MKAMNKAKSVLVIIVTATAFTLITKYIMNFYQANKHDYWDLSDFAISALPPIIIVFFDKINSGWSVLRIAAIYATLVTIVSYYYP